ncbi:hypothetical protein ACQPW3_22605 [Actinosynnema sp. CA-248983]
MATAGGDDHAGGTVADRDGGVDRAGGGVDDGERVVADVGDVRAPAVERDADAVGESPWLSTSAVVRALVAVSRTDTPPPLLAT